MKVVVKEINIKTTGNVKIIPKKEDEKNDNTKSK